MDANVSPRAAVKPKRYYDYTLLFMVIALIAFGVLMMASISAYSGVKYNEGNSHFYLDRQVIFAILGVAGMVVISLVDYRFYALETAGRKWPIFIIAGYLFIVAAQMLVIVIGRTASEHNGSANGASRWIAVGTFKIQPGEFAKLFMVVIAAYWLCRIAVSKTRVRSTLVMLIVLSVIVVLAMVESLTTAIVLVGIVAGLVFVTSRRKLVFVILLAVVILAGFLLIRYVKSQDTKEGGFRMRRVYEWLHLEDEDNIGQVKQGLYAIATGGLFGKGLGQSTQKIGHISEVYTDMIFTCIVEELGLVGGAALLILFGLVLWRIAVIALNAPDLYGTLLCFGVMTHIGLQVCFNIAVVTGLMPSTGVALPFFSYGGSALLVLCAECGIVLNVAKNVGYRRPVRPEREPERPERNRKDLAGGTVSGTEGIHKVKDNKVKDSSKFRWLRKKQNERKTNTTRGRTETSSDGRANRKSASTRAENYRRDADKLPKNNEEKKDGGNTYHFDVVLGQPSKKKDDE